MADMICPTCGTDRTNLIPPEPPDGAWIKDRWGGTAKHFGGGWGQPGCYPFAKWDAMWLARGPLVECGPWGADLG